MNNFAGITTYLDFGNKSPLQKVINNIFDFKDFLVKGGNPISYLEFMIKNILSLQFN